MGTEEPVAFCFSSFVFFHRLASRLRCTVGPVMRLALEKERTGSGVGDGTQRDSRRNKGRHAATAEANKENQPQRQVKHRSGRRARNRTANNSRAPQSPSATQGRTVVTGSRACLWCRDKSVGTQRRCEAAPGQARVHLPLRHCGARGEARQGRSWPAIFRARRPQLSRASAGAPWRKAAQTRQQRPLQGLPKKMHGARRRRRRRWHACAPLPE